MTPVARVQGRVAALPMANIDTDQLMPARFMKEPRLPQGYGRFLLRDLRDARPDGDPDPLAGGCAILVAGRNFGCGSSREAAVYALVDFGVRSVIAPGFGDIFAGNAVANGLIAATVAEADLPALAAAPELVVDLTSLRIDGPDLSLSFAIDPTARLRLLNGWDDIDLTRAHAGDIAAWVAADRLRRPWAGPPADQSGRTPA